MEKAVRIQRLTRNRERADVKLSLYSRETYLSYSVCVCVFYQTYSIGTRSQLISILDGTSSRERDQHRPSLASQTLKS